MIGMRRAGLALVAATMLLAACSHYALVPPAPYTVADAYVVEPQRPWSRVRRGGHELWTVDGPALQALHLWAGIADGEALIAGRDEHDKDVPVYRRGMRAPDVADLVAASISLQGGEATVEALRPAPFGALRGFRFELSFATESGLEKRAACLGAITPDGRLHLIVYEGAAEYYFGQYQDSVAALFGSVRTI